MKTKAAIAWGAGMPLTLGEADIEGPKAREALVEIKTTGKTNPCQAIRETRGKGSMPDGASRYSSNGWSLYHCERTSTFASSDQERETTI